MLNIFRGGGGGGGGGAGQCICRSEAKDRRLEVYSPTIPLLQIIKSQCLCTSFIHEVLLDSWTDFDEIWYECPLWPCLLTDFPPSPSTACCGHHSHFSAFCEGLTIKQTHTSRPKDYQSYGLHFQLSPQAVHLSLSQLKTPRRERRWYTL